jgi:hypothetical protein
VSTIGPTLPTSMRTGSLARWKLEVAPTRKVKELHWRTVEKAALMNKDFRA